MTVFIYQIKAQLKFVLYIATRNLKCKYVINILITPRPSFHNSIIDKEVIHSLYYHSDLYIIYCIDFHQRQKSIYSSFVASTIDCETKSASDIAHEKKYEYEKL